MDFCSGRSSLEKTPKEDYASVRVDFARQAISEAKIARLSKDESFGPQNTTPDQK